MYEYKAKIISVHDGDTFTAEIDLGFDMSCKSTFRLFGIDTPELNVASQKAAGQKARDFVIGKIANKTVKIQSSKSEGDKDKYGRYLAKVLFLDSDNVEKDLTELLLSQKFGVEYFGGKKA